MEVVVKGMLSSPVVAPPHDAASSEWESHSPSVLASDAASEYSSASEVSSVAPPVVIPAPPTAEQLRESLPPQYHVAFDAMLDMGFSPAMASWGLKETQGDLEGALLAIVEVQNKAPRPE